MANDLYEKLKAAKDLKIDAESSKAQAEASKRAMDAGQMSKMRSAITKYNQADQPVLQKLLKGKSPFPGPKPTKPPG